MATRVEADVEVQRFGFTAEPGGKRLVFPHAITHQIDGRSGGVAYGAHDVALEALEGRLDSLRWEAQAASIGGAWLRDDGGRFDLQVERAEMPHGMRLVRADRGVELLTSHATFSEARITINGPFRRSAPPPAAEAAPKALRQERLRFLDSVSGRIYLTIKAQLDLPVLGVRTLDQQLRVPIQEGSLDYRALDDSLDWLEGQFLDIDHDRERLRVTWKVPIFGPSHDLISWALDRDASTLAPFGRVPLRSLADFRIGAGSSPTDDKPDKPEKLDKPEKPDKKEKEKRKILQALTLDAIDVAVSLLAPRHLEAGGGIILFGGEDQPGIVDLKVSGAIRNHGAGALRGAIGSIDTTIKDLRVGSVVLTADRLHLAGLDQLEVAFDGFRPTAVTVVVHRVTATNLALQIGR